MADPSKSWVAKWQRIDGYVRGIYATKVMGQLPEEVISNLEEEYRIRYIPYVLYNRDRSEAIGKKKGKMLTLVCAGATEVLPRRIKGSDTRRPT